MKNGADLTTLEREIVRLVNRKPGLSATAITAALWVRSEYRNDYLGAIQRLVDSGRLVRSWLADGLPVYNPAEVR